MGDLFESDRLVLVISACLVCAASFVLSFIKEMRPYLTLKFSNFI